MNRFSLAVFKAVVEKIFIVNFIAKTLILGGISRTSE